MTLFSMISIHPSDLETTCFSTFFQMYINYIYTFQRRCVVKLHDEFKAELEAFQHQNVEKKYYLA